IFALSLTSVLRVILEISTIHQSSSPSIKIMMLLSIARLFEYLPLGFFAFALLEFLRKRNPQSSHKIIAASICVLLASSILIHPTQLVALFGDAAGRSIWLIIQAVLGTVIMCLAAFLVLSLDSRTLSCLI